MIELVNQQRRANGLPPLKHEPSLTDAARWYAKDMVDDDYFGPGHDTYDRSGGRLVRVCAWSARIGAFYTGANALGENLGEGYSSPQEVVDRLDGQLRAPGQHPERGFPGDGRRVPGRRIGRATAGCRTSAVGASSIPS